jgi:hypothetical protein
MPALRRPLTIDVIASSSDMAGDSATLDGEWERPTGEAVHDGEERRRPAEG